MANDEKKTILVNGEAVALTPELAARMEERRTRLTETLAEHAVAFEREEMKKRPAFAGRGLLRAWQYISLDEDGRDFPPELLATLTPEEAAAVLLELHSKTLTDTRPAITEVTIGTPGLVMVVERGEDGKYVLNERELRDEELTQLNQDFEGDALNVHDAVKLGFPPERVRGSSTPIVVADTAAFRLEQPGVLTNDGSIVAVDAAAWGKRPVEFGTPGQAPLDIYGRTENYKRWEGPSLLDDILQEDIVPIVAQKIIERNIEKRREAKAAMLLEQKYVPRITPLFDVAMLAPVTDLPNYQLHAILQEALGPEKVKFSVREQPPLSEEEANQYIAANVRMTVSELTSDGYRFGSEGTVKLVSDPAVGEDGLINTPLAGAAMRAMADVDALSKNKWDKPETDGVILDESHQFDNGIPFQFSEKGKKYQVMLTRCLPDHPISIAETPYREGPPSWATKLPKVLKMAEPPPLPEGVFPSMQVKGVWMKDSTTRLTSKMGQWTRGVNSVLQGVVAYSILLQGKKRAIRVVSLLHPSEIRDSDILAAFTLAEQRRWKTVILRMEDIEDNDYIEAVNLDKLMTDYDRGASGYRIRNRYIMPF